MLKFFTTLLLATVLTGCATSSYYGNHLDSQENINQAQLANEAVTQLSKLYPPAATRFDLKHETNDAFGISLVKGLRENGFAVIEQLPTENSADNAQKRPVNIVNELRYVLDTTIDNDMHLYRMSLIVNDSSITRPYLFQRGQILPAGYWVRKE